MKKVHYDNELGLFVAQDYQLACLTGRLYSGSPPVAVPILLFQEEAPLEYLFPGETYLFEEGAVLFGQLRSTCGGVAAHWAASEGAPITKAPYEPRIWGWGLTKFSWVPNERWEGNPLWVNRYGGTWVSQRGTEVPNFEAVFGGDPEPWMTAPEPSWPSKKPSHEERLFRAAFRAALHARGDCIPDRPGHATAQGHLEIDPVERPEITPVFTGQLFLNHFAPRARVSYQVTHQGYIYALAQVERQGTLVIARDHEPINLDPGWYLLAHPEPRGEEVD